ncbi:biopolymer transporter ExbB [uncultured Tateyamaria sp.]|uniref:biopolymer transporter ExbB n=1 Tax=uncultured Tateyamaria sp. TaxID=455651 RepID=UPI0026257658|nr:biopolymer transporter ExbB [uncultured Tateyamaria sp.]
MAQTTPEAQPYFSQPFRQIALMLIVLVLSGVGAVLALPRVLPVFQANPYLNGFIMFVFVIGVVACFWMVYQLIVSVRWIEGFAANGPSASDKAPQLLASLASLLRSRGARMQLSASSTRSILDSVATRIDEVREITRYIVNMLIFLGLLGTFYGLATTVPAVVDTIRSLAPQDGEGGVEVFNRLMTGLEAQLGGMGVAFASSLLGLAGSLIVGLLELFAGHGQNRFYRELEEWLSSITRVGLSSEGDGSSDQNAMAGVIDHLAEQMESLQTMFTQSDISRSMVDEKLGKLADAVDRMTTQMQARDAGGDALAQVAEGQERLIQVIERQGTGDGIDAESRMRLRSIDVQMLRILEEISAGRQETMAELRTDISALATALSQPRGQNRRQGNNGNRGPRNTQTEGDG